MSSDTWHELLDGKSHTLDFKVKHYLLNWNQMRSPVICSIKHLAFLLHPVAHYLFSLWPTEGVTVLSTKYYAVKMASKNIKMQNNSYKEHPAYNNGLSRKCFQKNVWGSRHTGHCHLSRVQQKKKKNRTTSEQTAFSFKGLWLPPSPRNLTLRTVSLAGISLAYGLCLHNHQDVTSVLFLHGQC